MDSKRLNNQYLHITPNFSFNLNSDQYEESFIGYGICCRGIICGIDNFILY